MKERIWLLVFLVTAGCLSGCGKKQQNPVSNVSRPSGGNSFVYEYHIGHMSDPPAWTFHKTSLEEVVRLRHAADKYRSRVRVADVGKELPSEFLGGQTKLLIAFDMLEECSVVFISPVEMKPSDHPRVDKIVKGIEVMVWLTLRGLQGDSDTALLEKIEKWERWKPALGSSGVNSPPLTK